MYSLTSTSGLISSILFFITSTLYCPTVFLVAIICLFRLVRQTLSSSIRSKAPTPLLTSASQTYPPTPPTPNTATRDLFSRSMASSPNRSCVLENWFNIVSYPSIPTISVDFIISTAHLPVNDFLATIIFINHNIYPVPSDDQSFSATDFTRASIASISDSFMADRIVTTGSNIVIFFMLSNMPFITFAADGAQVPFSTSATFLF